MSLFPRYHSHNHHGNSASAAMSPFWRLLEDPFFVPTTSTSGGRLGGSLFQPKFDVHETPEAFVLDGEVPGITDKNALDIHFTDQQTLVIHGRVEKLRRSSPEPEAEEQPTETASSSSNSKKPTVEDAGEGDSSESGAKSTQLATTTDEKSVSKPAAGPKHRVWVQERSVGEFQRSFNFPAGIDQDNVKATLKDGILTVTVPKMAQKGKRRINVE